MLLGLDNSVFSFIISSEDSLLSLNQTIMENQSYGLENPDEYSNNLAELADKQGGYSYQELIGSVSYDEDEDDTEDGFSEFTPTQSELEVSDIRAEAEKTPKISSAKYEFIKACSTGTHIAALKVLKASDTNNGTMTGHNGMTEKSPKKKPFKEF